MLTQTQRETLDTFLAVAESFPGAWQPDTEAPSARNILSAMVLLLPGLTDHVKVRWELHTDNSVSFRVTRNTATLFFVFLEQSNSRHQDTRTVLHSYLEAHEGVLNFDAMQCASLLLTTLTSINLHLGDDSPLSPAFSTYGRLANVPVILTLLYSKQSECWQALAILCPEGGTPNMRANAEAFSPSLFVAGVSALAKLNPTAAASEALQ